MRTPIPFIAPEVFDDPEATLARVQAIYAQSVTHLRQAMQRFVAGEEMQDRVRACYPYVRLETATDWTPPEDAETELLRVAAT
jgi:AMP nucleosidase